MAQPPKADPARAARAEIVRRANIPGTLRRLLTSERWPRERRATWIAGRVASQLAAARATPYGRETLPSGGGLHDVAPLDRATLRERFDDLRAEHAGPVTERATSGSTGRPVRAVHGPETVGYAAAARLRQLAWFGLPRGRHPQVNMRIAAAAGDPALVRDEGDPELFWLNPYVLDRQTVTQVHDALVVAGGVRLAGAESSLLARWARLYASSDRDARELGLRLAIAGGEMTYPHQREAARRAFGCPVAELYGSHELSIIATECRAGSLHVAEEAVLVELLGPEGDPVTAGERGEVVVTLLHNSEMPLLRYRLGDVAAWVPEPCSCGVTLARLDVEIGRLEEMVRSPTGALVHPRFLRSVYERCFGSSLRAFHTVQEGAVAFCVQLDLGATVPPGAERLLEGEIASYLGAPVMVRLEVGPLPAPGRKLRTFTSAL